MEVQGYPKYLIYPDGRVWSRKRKIFMKHQNTSGGYLHVILCHHGKKKFYKIHRLIALHYIPNPEGKPQVDHINRIRNDNRVENLRWATNGENQQNTVKRKDNNSGHKNISYDKEHNTWMYKKIYQKKRHQKNFKTKIDALCYKFIHQLKLKVLR
tara:strand:+ start:589 stop:1053 length:465 start_codon:yes stop_codon:yes gene_type:complete